MRCRSVSPSLQHRWTPSHTAAVMQQTQWPAAVAGTHPYPRGRSCMCKGSCSFWQWGMADKLGAACVCALMLVSLLAQPAYTHCMPYLLTVGKRIQGRSLTSAMWQPTGGVEFGGLGVGGRVQGGQVGACQGRFCVPISVKLGQIPWTQAGIELVQWTLSCRLRVDNACVQLLCSHTKTLLCS